jgi:putative transposase
MDPQSEKIALFRYGLIAPLVLEVLPRGELTRRAREIAAHSYEMPFSKRTQIAVDTLLHWAQRYRLEGLPGLAPKPRSDRGQSRVITPELAALIERLKRENPHRTGTTLLCELALISGSPTPPISASTLYRFLQEQGLTTREILKSDQVRKKFEAAYANHIWQSDLLHGPYVVRPQGGRRQVFLCAILDDASRLFPHAQFYERQTLEILLDCLRQAVRARGLPLRLYVDNGKIFRSVQLARIAASLNILVVHTPPYQPQGRGKIERAFRTIRDQFLANLDPHRLLTLEELNARFWTWLEQVYHRTSHSALGTTPLLRWQRDIQRVRQIPPSTDLRRLFFYRVFRAVRRDGTFRLLSRLYEAPPHLSGGTIEVRFDPLDADEVDLFLDGEPQGQARPVDPVINASIGRPRPPEDSGPPAPTGIHFIELLQAHHRSPQEKE